MTFGYVARVFAAQFLVRGITEADEGGVFVTFEETPDDVRKNLLSFGWDISAFEEAGKWAFVDVSPDAEYNAVVSGDYDLGRPTLRPAARPLRSPANAADIRRD